MKRNVEEILAQMTLEEKAALCSGQDFWHITGVPRLGIAPAMVSDGPHGLRKQDETADHLGVNDSIKAVCFPAGCATACSFDQDLIYNLGKTLGKECRAEHVSILLGPAMNIKRSPLCGRNFEYYSEDPYLAGKNGFFVYSRRTKRRGWNFPQTFCGKQSRISQNVQLV